MTIDDQIRDGINRQAAKISALSSNKIGKYEYLTGEEILPSNQKEIMEQAKFTYSPLGEAFKKQIKTIEDQGKKQVEASKDVKPEEQTNKSDDKLLMQKETYNRLLDERLNETQEISKKTDVKNLTYYFKTSGIYPIISPFVVFKEIRGGDKLLKEAKEEQIKFKSELNEITREKPTDKSKDQSDTIKSV